MAKCLQRPIEVLTLVRYRRYLYHERAESSGLLVASAPYRFLLYIHKIAQIKWRFNVYYTADVPMRGRPGVFFFFVEL